MMQYSPQTGITFSKQLIPIILMTVVSVIGSAISIKYPWFAQIGILLYGMPALFLVTYKCEHIRRWAYVIGLLGQPFWFITTFQHRQWGMIVLCSFYTLSWMNGIYQHWIKE